MWFSCITVTEKTMAYEEQDPELEADIETQIRENIKTQAGVGYLYDTGFFRCNTCTPSWSIVRGAKGWRPTQPRAKYFT